MEKKTIVIVGGSGVVGSRIAALLAPNYPGRVVIAGRSIDKATETTSDIGFQTRDRFIDISAPASFEDALKDATLVISCIDQSSERLLLHAAIERGLDYTDITPHLTELGHGDKYMKIANSAQLSGSHIILGTGIVPGISSMFVAAIAHSIGGSDGIETALLLSANDLTGPASFAYFLEELTMPFGEFVEGEDRPTRAMSHRRIVEFPQPIGKRVARSFPFSDKVLYPITMGAKTVRTALALDPPLLANLLAFLVCIGGAELLSKPSIRKALAGRRRNAKPSAEAPFALRVDVSHRGKAGYATLVGFNQADATAASAASTAQSLLEGEVREAGAWMPEQVMKPEAFFPRLAAQGFIVDLTHISGN